MRSSALLLAVGLALAGSTPAATADRGALAAGDAAWAGRAEGAAEGVAAAAPIARAVAAYARAVEADPDALEPRWKLLRALWFQGELTGLQGEARRAVFDRAVAVADEGAARLSRRLGTPLGDLLPAERAARLRAVPEAAAFLFWGGVDRALWGDAIGRLAAARRGVGGEVRDVATTVILLDPRLENGGAHRLLGRLHAEAPKVPLVTGWVDRDRAIAELERALELAPDDLFNRVYLAEALAAHRPAAEARLRELLRDTVGRAPRPETRVEDEHLLAVARRLLADLDGR